jgi:alkylresorcinol/alkylpyrone synthase
MSGMGFRDDVAHPVGLAARAGFRASLAAWLARWAWSNVLVVIELCTLAFRPDEMSKSNIIATALFGDGAAACVISTEAGAGRDRA